jgi:malonyl CoA-acyl carrier protein transacylase
MITSNATGQKTTPGKLAKELVSRILTEAVETEEWRKACDFPDELTGREEKLVEAQVKTIVERLTKKLGVKE